MGYEWLAEGLNALRTIEPHEVHQAMGNKIRWPHPATGPDGHWVLTVWARTTAGRPLIVITRRLSQWEWQIIGARVMTPQEITEFEAWEANDDDQ